LNRFVLPAILAASLIARAAPAELGQLDASPTLFTVMAAINAAGYDADLTSTNNHPLRNQIRAELAKKNIPSLADLKEFVQKHHLRDGGAELGQYISFALTASGPPDFAIKMRDVDVPPDVSGLLGLSPLLAAFYKEADIPDLWKRSQPYIDQYIARYHKGVSEAVLASNVYLRQPTSGFHGRHFQIFIELQAAPNQVQTRSYGNQYTVVVTPSPEPRIFDVRHAYLVYLLDPLALRNQEVLGRKKGLIDHAQRAQALADSFKQDWLLLATESLVKAVEARLDHRPQGVQEALLNGFILTPYFAEALPKFEQQEAAMMAYYPEMVGAINLLKEDQRLAPVQFNKEAPVRTVAVAAPEAPPPTGAAKTLDDAEQRYAATPRDLEGAQKLYLDVLQQTDRKTLHAAAYYGLARIAALKKDPESAQQLFQKTLESEPEPAVRAWALVYLGRLSMAAEEREQAAKYFQEALNVEGASDKARLAAREGLQSSSKQ